MSGDEPQERGSVVPLTPEYRAEILARLPRDPDGDLVGFEELARHLGVGRGTAERLVKGGRVSDETLKAACAATGLPYPIFSATDPDEADWIEAVQFLRAHRRDSLVRVTSPLMKMRAAVAEEIAALDELPKREESS